MGSNVTRHATHHDSGSPGRPARAGQGHRRLGRPDRPRRPGRRLTAVFATLAVVLGATGAGVVAPSGAAAAPSAYWPGHDVARRVVSNPAGAGGWTLNGWGAVNAFGGAPALSGAPDWGSWDIARDLAVTSSGAGGYVLDGWGGIHRLGDAPALPGAPYWRGFDIARRLVLNPAGAGGWVLDGWGGIHAFGGAPVLASDSYWRGWDIARDLVVEASGTGGYVLDGWGGVHPVGDASAVSGTPYWRGFDVARRLVLNPAGTGGWVLDGWGGIHRFGGAPPISGTPFWEGWDIARDLAVDSTGTAGYVLDGWDGVHHVLPAVAPSNTAPPEVSGTAEDAVTLTASDGTWTGTAPITFAYQWERCDDAAGEACADIDGATASTYTLTAADVGRWVRAEVTATNAIGGTHAWSPVEGPVAAAPPVNTVRPEASGWAADGEVLTAIEGDWTGTAPITFAYQWERCDDAAGVSCADIVGATASTYTLTSDDIGKWLRAEVTATNAAGTASASSEIPEDPVESAPPENTAVPVVSGTATDGETLTTTDGTWSGTAPFTFAYRWQRCDDAAGVSCGDIAGATASTYTLTSDDVGKWLRVTVTATHDGATVGATSVLTGEVAAAAPVGAAVPVISGTAQDGVPLTTTDGTWTGTTPMTFSYRWERCDDAGGTTCVDIAGATAGTYVLAGGDVGKWVRVTVVATNPGGTVGATSAPTGPVAAAPPVNTALPVISGDLVEGGAVATTDGTWAGSAPFTYEYSWYRCVDAAGTDCTVIGWPLSTGYRLQATEVGTYMKVWVRATNAAGSAEATSSVVGPVGGV